MPGPGAAERERPGYRRRILIEPAPGRVTAELEDDYHRMVVTLGHDGARVTSVEAAMKRSPWTTCPGAIRQLAQTFTGLTLDAAGARAEKTRNCTHLFDLATFACAHAGEAGPVAYEIIVTDPVDGAQVTQLWRNGALLFDWRMAGGRFAAPAELAGADRSAIPGWVAAQPPELQEAARILRWAAMIAIGRGHDIPAGIDATRFGSGACFSFQPEVAGIARRRPGADVDFAAIGAPPMADRDAMFGPA
ncbi:DUF2889 domain-containing protein [Novosphingobium bradum]|uniref:DUF2889 domain-containing protein n=1 Tax=Novosphingobium bradum TaxID=1737444 RepID=A0ABV7IM04_9SPHN